MDPCSQKFVEGGVLSTFLIFEAGFPVPLTLQQTLKSTTPEAVSEQPVLVLRLVPTAPCEQLQRCAHAESQLCTHSTSCGFPWAWGIPSQENQSTLSSLSCWSNTRVARSALVMVSQDFHPVLTQNMLQS